MQTGKITHWLALATLVFDCLLKLISRIYHVHCTHLQLCSNFIGYEMHMTLAVAERLKTCIDQ